MSARVVERVVEVGAWDVSGPRSVPRVIDPLLARMLAPWDALTRIEQAAALDGAPADPQPGSP